MSEWEIVIGLEVHAQLATASKIFSPCPHGAAEGPNLNMRDDGDDSEVDLMAAVKTKKKKKKRKKKKKKISSGGRKRKASE